MGRSRNVKKFKIELSKPNLDDPDQTSDDFAGTIVHEMLHQASYDHPVRSDHKRYYTQFSGNLVYEATWCVRSRGIDDIYASVSGSLSADRLQGSEKTWLRE